MVWSASWDACAAACTPVDVAPRGGLVLAQAGQGEDEEQRGEDVRHIRQIPHRTSSRHSPILLTAIHRSGQVEQHPQQTTGVHTHTHRRRGWRAEQEDGWRRGKESGVARMKGGVEWSVGSERGLARCAMLCICSELTRRRRRPRRSGRCNARSEQCARCIDDATSASHSLHTQQLTQLSLSLIVSLSLPDSAVAQSMAVNCGGHLLRRPTHILQLWHSELHRSTHVVFSKRQRH